MPKYDSKNTTGYKAVEKWYNELGDDRWELVFVEPNWAYFKRVKN